MPSAMSANGTVAGATEIVDDPKADEPMEMDVEVDEFSNNENAVQNHSGGDWPANNQQPSTPLMPQTGAAEGDVDMSVNMSESGAEEDSMIQTHTQVQSEKSIKEEQLPVTQPNQPNQPDQMTAPSNSQGQDQEFQFNAPSYYDLQNPSLEEVYVNNADEYFFKRTPQSSPGQAEPATEMSFQDYLRRKRLENQQHLQQMEQIDHLNHNQQHENDENQSHHQLQEDAEMAEHEHAHDDEDAQSEPTLELNGELDDLHAGVEGATHAPDTLSIPKDRFEAYESGWHPPQQLPRSQPQHHHNQQQGQQSYQQQQQQQQQFSRIMQPTQSYLRRLQQEQEERERLRVQQQQEALLAQERKVPKRTVPKSPKLRTSQKALEQSFRQRGANNLDKMSSTSREIQLILEEKARVEQEKQQYREFHDKVRAMNQVQYTGVMPHRARRQLTVPVSPRLEVGHRERCTHEARELGNHEPPVEYIPPEKLVSRDFALPSDNQHQHQQHEASHHLRRTVPHSPFLSTAERAARRQPLVSEQLPRTPEKRIRPPSSGPTKAVTPQLETSRRAQAVASYRRPAEIVDEDEEELAKQFHAMPLNRKILERGAPLSGVGSVKTKPVTKPVSPKLATLSRLGPSKYLQKPPVHAPSSTSSNHRSNGTTRRQPTQTVPETPPLKSLSRHAAYQQQLQQKLQREEERSRRQREFRAKPFSKPATPPQFEGSSKPLTATEPFLLQSEWLHEQSQQRIEQMRREEEEQAKEMARVRATQPLQTHGFHLKPTSRPPTRCVAPMLASERRAQERAAFEAAERERRAREEAYRKEREAEAKRLEEEELQRIRREQLTFKARPWSRDKMKKAFTLKNTSKPLTNPVSPFSDRALSSNQDFSS